MAASEAAFPNEPVAAAPVIRRRPTALARLRHDTKGRIGLVSLLVLAVVLFVVPPLLGTDANFQDLRARLVPPYGMEKAVPGHPLGTDQLGRDLLARLLVGGQTSLGIGVAASVLAAIIGVGAGMVAGYSGRFWDGLITSVADV